MPHSGLRPTMPHSGLPRTDQEATGEVDPVVGSGLYAHYMTTRVRTVSEDDLVGRRSEILDELGLTIEELMIKVETGGLVGWEWSAWSEIEDINYLLTRD